MKRKMTIAAAQGKRPEEICSKSLIQELSSWLHYVLSHTLCQMMKSNDMQGRNKGENEGIWKRQGRHGWGERGDVSISGKEDTSYESNFSGPHWFSFSWHTGKGSSVTSTMWSYPKPQLTGPSGYLSQAGPIISLSQDCCLYNQREHNPGLYGGLNSEMCTSQKHLRLSFPPSLYLVCSEKEWNQQAEGNQDVGREYWMHSSPSLWGPGLPAVSLPDSFFNYSTLNHIREGQHRASP